jgi:hypothetical protein
MSQNSCPTAQALLENFSVAATEYVDAAGKLSNLVGSNDYDQFIAAQRYAKQTAAKCRAALVALNQHRLEHSCKIAIRRPSWYPAGNGNET